MTQLSPNFSLGTKSRANGKGVHPDLWGVVEQAIKITTQDFMVLEGLRTIERQREYMKRGVTKTLNSKHLAQPSTGYSHAVDLVPVVDGQPRWEWPVIYPVALAMKRAAMAQNVSIRWGGVWDRTLADLPDSEGGIKKAVSEYCLRHPGPDFLDGPHFELTR